LGVSGACSDGGYDGEFGVGDYGEYSGFYGDGEGGGGGADCDIRIKTETLKC
jgi:hypothetical protein